jgi:flagellar basal-body rod protein FlgC
MSGLLAAIQISSKGLSVQRTKMNVVAQNLANAETTETVEGGPYRRKRILVSEDRVKEPFSSVMRQAETHLLRTHRGHRSGKAQPTQSSTEYSAVDLKEVQDPESGFKLVYDPSHPDADDKGYVRMPDIEVINEMVDMMAASRAYEANTVAIAAAKKMAKDALDI